MSSGLLLEISLKKLGKFACIDRCRIKYLSVRSIKFRTLKQFSALSELFQQISDSDVSAYNDFNFDTLFFILILLFRPPFSDRRLQSAVPILVLRNLFDFHTLTFFQHIALGVTPVNSKDYVYLLLACVVVIRVQSNF